MPSLLRPAIAPGTLAHSTQPALTQGPVTLRPWTTGDIPDLVAAYTEPEIQLWHARSMTPEEAGHWIAKARQAWSDETAASWAVDADGALAGRMSLRVDLIEGLAEVAYWTRSACRGRGVAPHALHAATRWAFSIGVQRVELQHSTLNSASCRVAAKAGFAAEGIRRQGALHTDGWHDMHLHGKISPEARDDQGAAGGGDPGDPVHSSGAPARPPGPAD